jgi:hypothetical protein
MQFFFSLSKIVCIAEGLCCKRPRFYADVWWFHPPSPVRLNLLHSEKKDKEKEKEGSKAGGGSLSQ